MIYNQTFVFARPTPIPVFVEQISGVEYPTREAAEQACHATMFDLNCTVPGDDSTHVRVTRTLEQWKAIYAEASQG